MNWIRSLLLACVLVLALPLSAQALTQPILGDSAFSVPPTGVPSDPPRQLSIFVADNGSLQAKRGAPFDTQPGMFFGGNSAPAANFWHLRVKGAPANDVTFGPRDTTVVTDSNVLDPASAWTAAAPARVDTVMRVQQPAGVNLFEVKQTVLYVARNTSYRVVWDIRNMTAQAIAFIFGTSADLFIDSDAGRGVLIDGPSRFLGGTNAFTGTTGGVQEVTSSQLPGETAATTIPRWASYEEGDPFPVTRRLSVGDAFLNTINPLFMDNGVGVSFNDRATTGLAAGATARYEVIWHVSRPATALAAAPAAAPELSSTATPSAPPAPRSEAVDEPAKDGGAAAAGDGRGTATTAGARDATAPVLSALQVAPTAAGSPPKIVFRLSERADVVLRIVRRAKGRQVTVRRLTRSGLRPGTRAIAPGVGSGAKRLKPGGYVVFAQAIDAAGNRGARRAAAFRITRR